MNPRMNSQRGFTLLELLIAAAIFLVLLGSVFALLVSSLRGYTTNEQITERQQDVESAVAVIRYDLALAGYRGATETAFASQTFGSEPSLEITKGAVEADPDSITFRYFEDDSRMFGATDGCGASYCEIMFQVGTEADGASVLYRIEGDGTGLRRGILQDLTNLKVIEYIKRNGEHIPATVGTPVPSTLAALNIELTLANGDLWRFPIGMPNEQSAVVN